MATIPELQQKLATFRASKSGAEVPTTTPQIAAPSPVAAPAAPSGVDPARLESLKSSLAGYKTNKTAAAAAPPVPQDPGALADFAKGLFGAPATLLARPIQAGAELFGASADQVDAATQSIPIVKDLVAPVPRTFGDVGKDVGRGAQTVALGLDAPLAAGALFGAGTSLEQGNDLLSTQTAFDTVLGAGGGKVLDLVGRPLLNAAGKAVGVITPQVLKDVAAGGAKAIVNFAADHEIPIVGGVSKPVSQALTKAARAVDDTVNGTAARTAAALKSTVAEQFPHLDPATHYTAINQKDILRPTTVNEPRFAKANSVFNDAANREIDLGKVATDNGIIHDNIAEGGKYNTLDTVENLREGNYKASDQLIRPAIKAAEPGVALVPIQDVRTAMLKKVNDIPAAQIDDTDRATLVKQITRRYADDSAAAKAHPNGYSLGDLHDARIIAAKNGKYKIGGTSSDALSAQRSREEGRVFDQVFNDNAPEALGIKPFKKELEKNFLLADYLEQLHGKKVPEGITKKAVRLFGRGVGGVLGSKIGGFPGFLIGSRGGDALFAGFETLPNPIKGAVLRTAFANKAEPAAFTALKKYLGDEETAKLMRLALPAGGESSAKAATKTLFATPGGQATDSLQEAVDMAGSRVAKKPTTDTRALKKKIQAVQESNGPYVPAKDLPVIKTGPKPISKKRLNDIL